MHSVIVQKLRHLIPTCLLALSLSFPYSVAAWELEHDEDGIKVYTQEIKGSSFKAFRGETHIRSNLHNLMAHHTNIEAMALWLQDCEKSEVLRKVSGRDFYIYQRTGAPWPVSDRDYVLHAKIDQNPSTYAITMTFEASSAINKNHDDCVPVTKLSGFWRFTPQADGLIFIEYETHADPSGDLPSWLANSFVVDQPLGTLEKMRQRVENNQYQLPEDMKFIIDPTTTLSSATTSSKK